MVLEYAAWKRGSVQYPLTAATTNSLLEDADPTLFAMLSFLAAAIRLDVGDRLRTQAILHQLVIADAVKLTLGVDPMPVLHANQFQFPLFALHRKAEAEAEHTFSWAKDVAEWEFAYVLPPLTPQQQIELTPILRSVARSIGHAIRQGWHPDIESGAEVLKDSGIQSARLVSCRYGGYAPIDNLADSGFYRAVQGTIEVVERDAAATGAFEDFGGANTALDHRQPDETVLADVVAAKTYQPPTITSLSPTSGTKAGGTTVTVTGTGFRTGTPVRIAIGGAECTSTTVLSTTQVRGVTPAHGAYPTFIADAVVTADDGQSDRLPAAYSFTTP